MATLLSLGDIAIIHYNSSDPDDFSFVFLRDVEAGTTINFTDNGWLASGGFRAGEGTVTYTAPTAITAGTVVTLSGLDLDAAGDQIIAYQGSAASPTVLYLVDFGDGNNTLAGDATDGNSTALPPGVALGSGAVAVAFNNGVYAGPTSGTPAQVFAAISDFTNWSGSDSAQQESRQEVFPLTGGGPTIDLDANNSTAYGSDATATYTAGGPGAPIGDVDVDIFAFDVDEVTITIAGNKMSGDRLSIVGNLPFGITASSYNSFTGQLTLSGNASVSAYEDALHQVVFSSTQSNPSTADRIINVVLRDDYFNSNTATAYIHVVVPRPPVNAVPGAQSVNEDATLSIGGVSVSDPDSFSLTTRLSVSNGTLTVPGGSGATVTGNGFDTIVISGSATQINNALAGLSYRGNPDFNGTDTLTVITSDGSLSDTDTIAITVNPVNDAPVNTVPGAQSVNEDTTRAIGGVSVADVDNLTLTTTLTVASGTLNVATGGGATIGGNGTGAVMISGTKNQINSALAGLSYRGNLNFNGTDTLTVATSDGSLSDTDTVAITVNAVNDPPVNTVPGAQNVNEDLTLAITGVSVADAENGTLTATLSVVHGTLNVSTLGGAAIGGNGTDTVTIIGTAGQINVALGGLTYLGVLNFNGADTLTITTSDGILSDTDTVPITVNAMNDAPANTVPGAQVINEDTTRAITGVSVADVDSAALTTTLTVANGTLTVAIGGGATIGGNGTGTVTISGSASQINSALGGLSYRGNLNFNGSDTLTVATSDGLLSDTDTVAITVNPVNDPPVNNVPGAQSINEDLTLPITGVSVADVDGSALTTTLNVAHGTLNVTSGGGAVITGNGSDSVTISGSATQINAVLATLNYRGNLNFNGADTLTVTTSDGSLSDTDTVPITVTAVNDAPVNTVPGPLSVNEDTTLAIAGVSVADVDSTALTTTLTVANGTLSVTPALGATVTGNASNSVTVSGTAAQINNVLATLSYRGNPDFNGADTLTVNTSDGSLTDVDTVPITVDAVNDPPVNTVPGAQSVNEDTTLPIAGVAVADVDGSALTTTLSVVNGTLHVATGGGALIGGNDSATVTINGTAAQIGSALAGLSYLGGLNFSGADTLTVTTSDGSLSDTDTVAITVNAVNDPPVNTVPGAQSVNEDVTLPIAGVSVADVDSSTLTTTLAVSNGILNVTPGAGVSGSGTATVTITGTAAQINSALAGLSYRGNLNFNGSDTLTLSTSDGLSTDTDSLAITVTATNDAPVTAVPGAQTVDEDTALAIAGVSVADVDSGALTTTLSVTNGTLSVTAGGGAVIGGNGSGSVTISGSAAQVNSALAGLSYLGNPDFNGSDTLTVATSDGSLSDIDTIGITVNAVNDAPVNTVPGPQTANEDAALPIPGLSVADVDSSALTTTLSVVNGFLTLIPRSGISGNGTGTVVITGTASQINTALASLSYHGNADFNGSDTLTVTTSDGSLSDTDTVPITVNAVNDAPVNTVPGAQTVDEDTALAIAGVSVSDVDSAAALTTVVSVAHGTLTVAAGGGAVIAGNGSDSVTITGTAAEINDALAALSYLGELDFSGADTLTVTTSDGALSDIETVPITVNAVNDAPVNTVPSAQSVNEDTTLAIAGVSIADVDSAALTATLAVVNGTLTVTSGGGAAIGGNGSGTVTISGSAAQINAALAGLKYHGNLDFSGADTLTVTTSDGTLSDVDTVPITVSAVNDRPVNTVPGPQTVAEDTVLPIAGVSVSDIDSTALSTTLEVSNGTLTVATGGGALVTGDGSAIVTISGTAAQINAALAGLSYLGNLDFNGTDTLIVTTSDGSLSDIDTVGIAVGAVGDPPVNTVPGAQTVNEDTALPIAGVSVSDTDSVVLTSTLSVANGTLSISGTRVSSSGSGTVTITGTQSEINAALGTLTYVGNPDFHGVDTLTVSTFDGSSTDTDTVAITVDPVNDAPVNTVPGAQSVNEDTTLPIFGLSVADVDGDALTTTLTVAHGTLSATGTGVSGSGSATLTIAGTAAEINAALATLSYLGDLDFHGSDTLTVTTTDGSLSDADTVAISVKMVNDAPVNTVPGAQSVDEDTVLPVSGLAVADVDTLGLVTTLTVAHGTLTATGAGISGSGTGTIRIAGPVGSINFALGTLTYLGGPDFNGSDTLTVTTSDGSLSDTDTVAITVDAVNDAPVNTVPGAQTVNEDSTLPIAGVSVADVDSASLTTTLSVTSGTLTVETGGGAVITGNGDSLVTISGSAGEINDALSGLSYLGNLDSNGTDTLTVATSDGTLTDTDTIAITVNPVNDAPTLSLDSDASGGGDGTNFFTGYVEGGPAVPIADTDTVIDDPDSANLASALIAFVSFDADDRLSVNGALPAGITASAYDPVTGTLTLSGSASRAAYQAALQQIEYSSVSQDPDPGPHILSVTVNDGNADSNTAFTAIAVLAVNTPPVNIVPGAQSGNEDTALPIADVSVDDPDSASLTTTLSVTHGILNVTAGAGVSGNGSASVTITGIAAEINAALAGLSYLGDLNFNGADTLTVATSDGEFTDTDTVAINVNPVNDAPVNTVPGAQSVDEDTALSIAGLAVADVDSLTLVTTLTVAHGTLTATGTGVSGSGSGTVTIVGSAAQVGTALGTLSYLGNPDFNGADTLTVSTSDGGLSDTDTVAITVNPVNDAPVTTVPGAQSVDEDTTLPIGGVSVADVDSAALTTTLTVTSGTLTVGTGGGATIGGNGTGTVTVAGSAAQINAALATLRYLGNLDFTGSDMLTVTTSDGSLSDTGTVAITVNPVDDPPVNTVPGPQTVDEDTVLPIAGLAVADLDTPGLVTTLTVAHGTLTATGAGVSGSGTATLTIAGPVGNINLALATLAYLADPDFSGADTLTVVTSDSSSSDTDTVAITVNPVNDAPVNTVPGAQSVDEDTVLPIAGVSVADADSAALVTTLTVGHGTLGATGTGVSGSGTATLTIAGSAAQINAALATLSYLGTANFHGPDTLTVSTSDGSLTDTDTVAITVDSVNDPPVNTVPGAQSVSEDTVLPIAGLAVADADSLLLVTTLTVAHGTLTATGLGVSGSGTTTLTIAGLAAEINAALGTLSYLGDANFNGADTLTVTTSDSQLSDTDTVAITVNPVNDPPVNTVPGPQSVDEDTLLLIGGVSVADVDSAALTTTLTVGHGTLTATGAGVSGSGTATLTIAGSAAQVNAALGTLAYRGNADFNGADTLTVATSDGSSSDTDTVAIAVNPVDDAPINTVPGAQIGNEDTLLPIAGLSVADLDSLLLVTRLTVAHGTLAATGPGVDGSGTATLTILGPPAQVNAALGTLTYLGDLNFSGADTLSVSTFDGTLTDTDTVAILVGPANDAPLLDLDPDNSSAAGGPNYATTFSEGGAPVPIADTDVSVFDTDNLFLASATITLTNHQPGDLLSVGVLPASITASSYDPATGVLTLSGTNATQADFASALQAVTFSSTNPDPSPIDRNVNVVVKDGVANSNGANTFIHVLPVNTAPTLDLDANNSTAPGRAYHATFTAGTAPVPVADGDVLITDIDNTTLISATIRLVNLKPDDVLSVNGTLPGLISTIGYDAATGTLTLTGATTLADYQTALHQIEFSNTSLTPDTTTRQLAITVNDGTADSATASAFISVLDEPATLDLDANDSTTTGTDYVTSFTEGGAAAAIADADVTISGSAQIFSATITLTNPQAGDLLSVSGILPPGIEEIAYDTSTGVLQLRAVAGASPADFQTALQQVFYKNTSDNPATDDRVASVTVDDGTGNSNAALAFIHVTAVDDPPALAVAPSATYLEQAPPATLSPVVIVSDPDNPVLTVAAVAIVDPLPGDNLLVGGTVAGRSGAIQFTWQPLTQQLILSGPGTESEYQALFQSVQFASSSDDPTNGGANPTRTIAWLVFDGTTQVTQVTTLTIRPVNDAPVNTLPPLLTAEANTDVPISGLAVDDPDAGTGLLTTVIGVEHGTLTLAPVGGATVMGNGSATVMIIGTLADINATLAAAGNIVYHAPAGFTGDTFTMLTDDGANTGSRARIDIGTSGIALASSPPTGITLSGTAISEFSPDGTVIGSLAAIDADAADTFTFTLLDDAGARFAIDGTSLVVAHGLLLDFEQAVSHVITVQVTDGFGLTFQQDFSISVGNVDPEIPSGATGGAGGTTIIGGPLDDRIALTAGNNTIDAGGGNDVLTGGPGNDRLTGAAGDDTAIFTVPLASTAPDDFGIVQWIDIAGGDGSDRLFSIEHLQFPDGTVHVDDGDLLFDTLFYDHRNPDVFHAVVDARQHYAEFGWHEGRDPNAFFSTTQYLSAYRDAINPDDPTPSPEVPSTPDQPEQPDQPDQSDQSDLATNPDESAVPGGPGVTQAAVTTDQNPLEHYRDTGWRLGFDPSLLFDTTLYLIHNPDVAAAGVNPLEHFLQFGRAEGRAAYPSIGQSIGMWGFDAEFYLMSNRDVAAAGVDPLQHYEEFGWHEGRNPNRYFDTAGYLARYADVAAAGVNPLQHYDEFGWREGRDPSGAFDTQNYLAASPDVAAAGVNPLVHLLQFGIYEGRDPFADGVFR